MSPLVKEVLEYADELRGVATTINRQEALTLAVAIQHNRILRDAYLEKKNIVSWIDQYPPGDPKKTEKYE